MLICENDTENTLDAGYILPSISIPIVIIINRFYVDMICIGAMCIGTLLILGSLYAGLSAHTSDDEIRLHKDLFTNHNPLIRPVQFSEDALHVNLSLFLVQIASLDDKTQVLQTTVYFDVSWYDELLIWNTSDYNGTYFTLIPKIKIWIPDLIVSNSIDAKKGLGEDNINVILYHSGYVLWQPTKQVETSCVVNVEMYPFDSQDCTIEISKQVTNDELVAVSSTFGNMDMSYFKENGQWTVAQTSESNIVYGIPGDTFSFLTWTIRLSRRPRFYIFNVILPVILLSFLNSCAYMLPLESGEKISFCVTMFLSLSVFLTLISDSMPQTSTHLSYLAVFLTVELCSSVSILITEMLVMRLYFKEGKCRLPLSWRRFGCKKRSTSVENFEIDSNKSSSSQSTDDQNLPSFSDVAKFLDRVLLMIYFFVNTIFTAVFMIRMTRGP